MAGRRWSVVLDYKDMPIEHIVVDGSNIATEGRSLPSLKQLEEAVAELRRDHPNAEITVIVDATFAHRIDPSELRRFEEAALHGDYVHPPAGAIGRGDAFLLRVAEKVDATVLSNDSFQEFHGEHPWLFERGRLLGGTPVPGIGWIFSPRQPVRGPRSHQAVRETVQAKKRVTKAIAVATKEVVEPAGQSAVSASPQSRSRSRKAGVEPEPARAEVGFRDGAKPTPLAVNDPLAFISFIAEHPLGEQVEGEVEGYTSHGAVVRVGEMRCYVPLANLGDPAPRSAREVLKRHERGIFVLTALDPQRRGAELALPGIAHVSGHPREETVAAEVRLAQPARKRPEVLGSQAPKPAGKVPAAQKTGKRAAVAKAVAPGKPAAVAKAVAPGKPTAAAKARPPAKSGRPAKAATAKKIATSKTAVKKAPVQKAEPTGKTAPARQVVEKSASAKRPASKVPAAPPPPKKPAEARTVAAKKAPLAKSPSPVKRAPTPRPVTEPPASATAPRARRSSRARASVQPSAGPATRAPAPPPADVEPRARRSPRTTANADRTQAKAAGRSRRGTR
jgi:hypothetical protein